MVERHFPVASLNDLAKRVRRSCSASVGESLLVSRTASELSAALAGRPGQACRSRWLAWPGLPAALDVPGLPSAALPARGRSGSRSTVDGAESGAEFRRGLGLAGGQERAQKLPRLQELSFPRADRRLGCLHRQAASATVTPPTRIDSTIRTLCYSTIRTLCSAGRPALYSLSALVRDSSLPWAKKSDARHDH